MALAYLNGGGGGGGIRHKNISAEDYERLSYADQHNPYVIWIITDRKANDMGGVAFEGVVTHVCTWAAYSQLSVDEQNDPKVLWIINDKNPKDLQKMGIGANEDEGSRVYNVSAELDYAEMTKTINALIDRVNTMSMALNEISARLNSEE